MSCFGNQALVDHVPAHSPSLNLDLLSAGTSSLPNMPYQPPYLSDMDKSLMSDIASKAMEELLRLVQTNEPLWLKSNVDGRDVLNSDAYERIFPKPNSRPKNPNVRLEASRDSAVVLINSLALADMFMDPVCFSHSFSMEGLLFCFLSFSLVTNEFAEQVDGTFSHYCLGGSDYSSHIFWDGWFFASGNLNWVQILLFYTCLTPVSFHSIACNFFLSFYFSDVCGVASAFSPCFFSGVLLPSLLPAN